MPPRPRGRRLLAAGAVGAAAGLVGSLAGGEAWALDPAKTPSQYVIHLWQQSDDGLPQNFVPAMAQTRDGYLWLATQEGVVRFDGARFVVFTATNVPGLGTNDVGALAPSADGGLWIGTRGGGLTRYANGGFTSFTPKDGLTSDFVLALHEARDGTLWIGTRDGAFRRDKDGRFSSLHAADGLGAERVTSIAEGADGSIWLGTDGGGVSRVQGNKVTTTLKAGLADPSVSALTADADGTLWVGTPGGLDHVKDGIVTPVGALGNIHALLRDAQQNLWIAAQDGLRRLSSDPAGQALAGTMTPFGLVTKLDTDGVHRLEAASLLEDREGNLWAGLESVGLVQLQDGKVTTFGSDFVWTTFLDAHGTLWLGGDPGLSRLEADVIQPVAGSSSVSIIGIAQGPGDALWLATTGQGLFTYDGGKLTPVGANPAHARGEGTVRSIVSDARGALWYGTSYGLARREGTQVRRFHPADGMPDIDVRTIAEGRDGTIWVGTVDGLFHGDAKNEHFSRMTVANGLTNNAIDAFYVDGDDLWVGTYGGGLDLLRGGKIGGVTTRNGLFNDVVYSIVDDQAGTLWMSCNRGIFAAKKADLVAVATGAKTTLACTALSTSDGMKSSECNGGTPAGVRDHDGMLWFATSGGAVRVDPTHMKKNTVVPPVRVEEMSVDRAPVDLATLREVAAGSRDFEIGYTALSFTASDRVRFKYKLEGFDKGWVDAGARRVAYYTNLTPGPYAFNVIAANDDGVWNETGATIRFVLPPRFYQTVWFGLACALGLVLIGAGSVRLRLLALRQKAAELEAKVEQRTQELARASTKLEGAFTALAEKDQRLHQDLLQAKAFQERILPRLPSGRPVRFRAVYRPADLVGGDLYDVCELGDGHFRVFLADTTGHGIQASLRTMVLKTEYDRVKLSPDGPGRVLAELNTKLATVYPDLAMRCSACCFDVVVDDEGATIRYANAAHPPLLRVCGGEVDEIYVSGTFLGIVSDVVFKEREERLGLADRLLAYTDGICEQEDKGGRAFGVERMEALLASEPRTAEEIVQDLDAALTTFVEGRPLEDDVVLVCVECAGERRSMASFSSAPIALKASAATGKG